MFSSHFGGCDPSRRHRKAKNDAFGNTFYFGYDKNKPNTDFPMFYIQFWHHFGEHFSINSSVGFRHSKMQKVQSTLAFPATLPRTHHRRGGNQEASSSPGSSRDIFLINHHHSMPNANSSSDSSFYYVFEGPSRIHGGSVAIVLH